MILGEGVMVVILRKRMRDGDDFERNCVGGSSSRTFGSGPL